MAKDMFETTSAAVAEPGKDMYETASKDLFNRPGPQDIDLSYMSRPEPGLAFVEGQAQMGEQFSFSVLTEEERARFEKMGKMGVAEAFERTKFLDLLPFSPTSIWRSAKVKGAVERLQAGEYDDPIKRKKDEETFIEFARAMEEESIRGYTWAGNVYRGVSQLPGFMFEFGATGGLAAGAKAATTKGLSTVAKAAAAKGVKAAVAKTALVAAQTATMAAVRAPVMYNRYVTKYNENQIHANIALTDKGVGVLKESEESAAVSMYRAGMDTYIEVWSESLGEMVFRPIGKVIGGKITSKLSPELQRGVNKVMKVMTADGKITRFLEKGGFSGTGEEIMEEYAAIPARVLFGVETYGAEPREGEEDIHPFDKMRAGNEQFFDELGVMFGIFSIPGATSYTAQKLYGKMRRRGYKAEEIENAKNNLSQNEREQLLARFQGEEGEWLQSALVKATAGQELTGWEQYAVEEEFNYFVEKGWIHVGDTVEPPPEEEGAAEGKPGAPTIQMAADVSSIPLKAKIESIKAIQKGLNEARMFLKQKEEMKSNLLVAAESKLPEKGITVEQAIRTLQKAGISKEEMEWAGVEQFVKEKGTVTKKELLDHIDQNKISIDVKVLGGPREIVMNANSKYYTPVIAAYINQAVRSEPDIDRDGIELWVANTQEIYNELNQKFPGFTEQNENWSEIVTNDIIKEDAIKKGTRYGEGKLVLPGGKNYQEVLISLPTVGEADKFDPGKVEIKRDVRSTTQGSTSIYYGGKLLANYGDDPRINPDTGNWEQKPESYWMEIAEKLFNEGDERNAIGPIAGRFTTGHWPGEKNVLLHLRYNMRTDSDGKKVLFIEEIQSDWHHQGRKKGYGGDTKKAEDNLKKVIAEIKKEYYRVGKENGFTEDQIDLAWATANMSTLTQELGLHDRWATAMEELDKAKGGVPNAPFKGTWPLLALKQAIQIGVENGADRIAWISGAQTQDRYDLRKYVEYIDYKKDKNGTYWFHAKSKFNDRDSVERFNVKPEDLDSYVGKEIADRIRSQEGERYESDIEKRLKERGKGIRVFQKQYTIEKSKKSRPGEPEAWHYIILVDGNANVWGRPYNTPEEAKDAISNVKNSWYVEYEDGSIMGTWISKEDATNEMNRQNTELGDLRYRLSEEGLAVGGEWAINLYDKSLVNIANKYIKKWGSQVKDITFEVEGVKQYIDFPPARSWNDMVDWLVKGGELWQETDDTPTTGDLVQIEDLETLAEMFGENGEDFTVDDQFEIHLVDKKEAEEIKKRVGTQKGFDITPAMANEVTGIGQAMFGNALFGGVSGEHLENIYKPEVVTDMETAYHGSPAAKDILEKGIVVSPSGELGPGFYFTRDPDYAKQFIFPVEKGKEGRAGVLTLNISGMKFKEMTKQEFIDARAKYFDAVQQEADGEWDGTKFDEAVRRFEEDLVKQGFDGIYIAEENQGVVFPASVEKLNVSRETPDVAVGVKVDVYEKDLAQGKIVGIKTNEGGQEIFTVQMDSDGTTLEMLREGFEITPKPEAKPAPKKESARVIKYRQMLDRLDEIKATKQDLTGKLGVLTEFLDELKRQRKEGARSVRRYKDGHLNEEYDRIPKYYRTTNPNAMGMDEMAGRLGLENESAVAEYFRDLDRGIERAKEEVKDMRAQIKEETQKTVIKSEVSHLRQRITDFMAGFKEAAKRIRAQEKDKMKAEKLVKALEKKELEQLRKEVTDTARKLLPASGKKFIKAIISAMDSVKKAEDAPAAIARIVDNYDQWLAREKKIKAVKAIMKKYKHPENIIDANYQEEIDKTLAKYGAERKDQRKAIKELGAEELEALAKQIAALREEGKKSKAEKDALKKMASELMRAAGIVSSGGTIDIEAIGSLEEGDAAKGMTKAEAAFIRPLRLVRKIFGKYGEKLFYDSVEFAETLAQAAKAERFKKIADVLKKHNLNIFKLGKTIEIDGKTFRLNDVMTMYAQRNNEEARKAIIFGNKINETLFNKFVTHLEKNNPEAVAAVNEIKEIVGNKYEELRQKMLEAFNIIMPKVADYFPMNRQRLDAHEDPELMMGMDIVGDAALVKGNQVDYTAVEKGFGISRKQISDRNQKPISLDFLGDAMRAIDTQEHFLHFAGVQKMYNSVKTDEQFANTIIYNHGYEAWKAFDTYMNEAINPRINMKDLGYLGVKLRGIRRALGVFYLGFNVITAMKQFPSAHLALKYTNLPRLYSSMYRVMADKDLRERIFAMDPSLKNRVVERDIQDLMNRSQDLSEKDLLRALQIAEASIGRGSMKMILMMDRWAVLAVYDAVYEHQRRIVGEKEAMNLAHKAVLETQPQGRRVDLPAAYRQNDEGYRLMLMFTNQLNQIYNMLRYDLPAEWQEDKGKAMVGLASIMASSLMIYAISHGGSWPDDEEEQYWALFDALFGSMVSSIPILGNLFMSIGRGYSPSINPAQSIVDSLKYTKANIENEEYGSAMVDALSAVAIFAGLQVPAGPIRRSMRGLIDLMEGESGDPRRLIWSSSALYEE